MTKALSRCDDLHGQLERLAEGRVTSLELTQRALAAIHASQPTLNTFRYICDEAALAEADAADRRRERGDDAPLLGVPIALKDDVDCKGLPSTLGSACNVVPAAADAHMVRRLREAGAVILGKTQASELLQWPFSGGPRLGHVHNPWQRGATAGGSSGGSAAAVAAGLVSVAMGSDGAGSIRIPAAWNNLIGIKPQRGRISTAPDPDMMQGLAVLGPLARTVRDAARLFDAVAGAAPGERHAPPPVTVSDSIGRDTGRLRIALALAPPFTATSVSLDSEIRSATHEIAETLANLGHEIIERSPRHSALLGPNFLIRASAGLAEWRERLDDDPNLEKRTLDAARMGARINGRVLRSARRTETWLASRAGRIFDHADIVLAPTTSVAPPAVDAIDNMNALQTGRFVAAACPWAWPWNVLGWPSVNVPAGFNRDGLPTGVQLMGPANSEPLLVAVADQLEQVWQWSVHEPEPWWQGAGHAGA
jgi:amidase